MFNKTELRMLAWGEKEKIYIAKQLPSLHVKYNVIDEEKSITEYNMRVNKKQLSDIVKYIAPMFRVFVKMKLHDGSYVTLTR